MGKQNKHLLCRQMLHELLLLSVLGDAWNY